MFNLWLKTISSYLVLQIRMGGMIYCPKEKRGIKRGYLPAPRNVEFTPEATYEDVLTLGREMFFSEIPEADAAYYLAESSGVALPNVNPGMSL